MPTLPRSKRGKVWIINCYERDLLYDRRSFLVEAKMIESLRYLRRKYPRRTFKVTSLYYSYGERDEDY